mmetsp:Transcript_24036/g.80784  ORF Transcript_24036/g.80784 Transcript_24036/m.80784 type:complete len:259 (-) Transcript_24036:71-847(-)
MPGAPEGSYSKAPAREALRRSAPPAGACHAPAGLAAGGASRGALRPRGVRKGGQGAPGVRCRRRWASRRRATRNVGARARGSGPRQRRWARSVSIRRPLHCEAPAPARPGPGPQARSKPPELRTPTKRQIAPRPPCTCARGPRSASSLEAQEGGEKVVSRGRALEAPRARGAAAGALGAAGHEAREVELVEEVGVELQAHVHVPGARVRLRPGRWLRGAGRHGAECRGQRLLEARAPAHAGWRHGAGHGRRNGRGDRR